MADPDEPELDWFGNPLGPREGGARPPVPCPLCAAPFTDQAPLAAHVAADHGVKLRPGRPPGAGRPSRTDRITSWWRSLGYLPLWFVLPPTVGLMALAYRLVRPIDGWLAAYAAVLASLPLVLVLSRRVFGQGRSR